MPQLIVNLDDLGDCRRSIQILRQRINANAPLECKPDSGNGDAAGGSGKQSDLPLNQRMKIIAQRGVWRHLVNIARCDDTPRSLPEWDDQLGLPRNKLRSLKGNFAKLENRFNVCFLRVAGAAVPDENNNPRYIMPPRIRNQILALHEETASAA